MPNKFPEVCYAVLFRPSHLAVWWLEGFSFLVQQVSTSLYSSMISGEEKIKQSDLIKVSSSLFDTLPSHNVAEISTFVSRVILATDQ
ncbi:MAG: hypothetical protein AABX47_05680 [Nanoarchaeota archaeon]